VGPEKEKEEVRLMRRILLLMTVAALVVVGTLLAVSVAGAHKHPTAAMAQKHPTRKVVIKNFSFKPAQITIKRGTKVRWINRDSTTHTATANKKRSFDSGRLSPGQSYTHLQESGKAEVPLRDTSRYDGKYSRQALAVDEGKRPF
jgi:plastocyanin